MPWMSPTSSCSIDPCSSHRLPRADSSPGATLSRGGLVPTRGSAGDKPRPRGDGPAAGEECTLEVPQPGPLGRLVERREQLLADRAVLVDLLDGQLRVGAVPDGGRDLSGPRDGLEVGPVSRAVA